MINAYGITNLTTNNNSDGYKGLLKNFNFWSSTERSAGYAARYDFYYEMFNSLQKNRHHYNSGDQGDYMNVRACLAF